MPHPSDSVEVDFRKDTWPVRDQEASPVCMAFAVTATHEVARRAFGHHLSEAGLQWACREISQTRLEHMSFGTAGMALSKYGQPLLSHWPYEKGWGLIDISLDDWFIAYLDPVPVSFDSIRQTMLEGFAVALGLPITKDLHKPGSPPFLPVPNMNKHWPLHAVSAIGVKPATSSMPEHLIIRNSWGSHWGDSGHAYLTREYVDKAVVDAFAVKVFHSD